MGTAVPYLAYPAYAARVALEDAREGDPRVGGRSRLWKTPARAIKRRIAGHTGVADKSSQFEWLCQCRKFSEKV
jgi:hypothetical protein